MKTFEVPVEFEILAVAQFKCLCESTDLVNFSTCRRDCPGMEASTKAWKEALMWSHNNKVV